MADDRRHAQSSSPSRVRGKRRSSEYGEHKRGLNSKNHLAVDAHGMPVRVFITSGTTADCIQAENLIEGIKAENLLADKGYDSNQILRQATEAHMQGVIPPKKNRKIQREYDKALYKHRHLVENSFLHLKRWRGIALVMQRIPPLFSLQYKYAALPYGSIFHDDTI